MTGWLAIVNRHSGGNDACGRSPELVRHLGQIADKTVFTEYPGHAADLARDAKDYYGLAAVGGDGTLFEILRGLNREKQRIAIIPSGRGNSLARDLGLLGSAPPIDVINCNSPSYVDLLEVTFQTTAGRELQLLSASTVALGYPVAVAKAARQFSRLGSFCYAASTSTVRPVPFAVETSCGNGIALKRRVSGLIANNTRHLANFLAFPKSNCADGFFELMELSAGFFWQTAHNVSALLGARFYNPCQPVTTQRAYVRLDDPQDLMIDGEFYEDTVSIRIQILPSALACSRRIQLTRSN